MFQIPGFEHYIVVGTNDGKQHVLVSNESLNTWTRKDGGFTVRLHHTTTYRFDRKLLPKVVARG